MNKNFNRSAIAAAILSAAVSAQAVLPTGVATSITEVGVDGATLVGAMAVVGAAVYLISKLLRKFGVML